MKDNRGIKIEVGDKILFQGSLMEVLEIKSSLLVGGALKGPARLPGELVCKCTITVDHALPVNCLVLADKKERLEGQEEQKKSLVGEA